ncbi:NADH-quinone oxidoreductase subunit D [Roseospirillum parvum]|uniref:NADH-quinone oxidoreductase subunit D n=1 Tax=Roseospirillum parvum TaxID=83401 RepID=A0A1G8B4E8_9PROT|nr:NADH-quinone oxidoreductase subunit D [Roseospirillum parvum]SDH28015.1 NADH-quinone oxidoreductase subunit D [Roseospirillum parvum]
MAQSQIRNFNLNFGPQHPAAHGVLRLVLELDGEVVERADPHVGLLHRGTEKLIEHKTYLQALPYFDRLDYACPLNMEHSYVIAVERLLGIEPPPRAKYLRTLFAELTRIYNHLMNTTSMVMDVGAMTPMLWGFEEREKIHEFFEGVSGARMHLAWFRPGGVAFDMPEGMAERILAWNEAFTTFLDDFETMIDENRIFKQRTVDVSVVSQEQALDLGFTGPCLRATGLAWDLRKAQPYDAYEDMDFQIPTAKSGDCYARYLVRMAEFRESQKIIRQCLENLPDGEVRSDSRKIQAPSRAEMKHSMEALIHHFKLYTEGFHVPPGEVYAATEAATGEFGVYLVSDGTNRPYRCSIRSPGYVHLSAMDTLMKGHMLADAPACIGSIDVVFGEVDR